MGLNIRKSFKLGNLLRVNKNKKGLSVSVGGKNVRVTLNDKNKVTASLPGTGISYDTTIGDKPAAKKPSTAKKKNDSEKACRKETCG